jgi:hypothetical protein
MERISATSKSENEIRLENKNAANPYIELDSDYLA